MTDRGERIVSLAREMLAERDETPSPTFADRLNAKNFSIKAMCLVLALGAFGTGLGVRACDEALRPANHYERTEIEALLFYATQQKALSGAMLRRQLEAYLSLPSLDRMTANDYKAARAFLLDRLP